MKTMRRIGMMVAAFGTLAGCGADFSPNTYSTAAVQQANKVDRGSVIGVRKVDVSAPGVVGAAAGGAVGGVAGAQTPGGGIQSAFGAIGGALVGGLIGSGVEHAAVDTFAYEYIVRRTTGDLVSVTQKDDRPLSVGDKVLVISGNQARVIHDYTVTSDEPAVTPSPLAPRLSQAPTQPSPITAYQLPPLLQTFPSENLSLPKP